MASGLTRAPVTRPRPDAAPLEQNVRPEGILAGWIPLNSQSDGEIVPPLVARADRHPAPRLGLRRRLSAELQKRRPTLGGSGSLAERPVHALRRREAVDHRLADRDREFGAQVRRRFGGRGSPVSRRGVLAILRSAGRPYRAAQFALQVVANRFEIHEVVEGFRVPGGDRLADLPRREVGAEIDAGAQRQERRPGEDENQIKTPATHLDNTNGRESPGFLRPPSPGETVENSSLLRSKRPSPRFTFRWTGSPSRPSPKPICGTRSRRANWRPSSATVISSFPKRSTRAP